MRLFGLPVATRLTSDTENQSDPALFIGQGKFVQTWHGKRFAPASVALQPRANSPFEGEIALRCCRDVVRLGVTRTCAGGERWRDNIAPSFQSVRPSIRRDSLLSTPPRGHSILTAQPMRVDVRLHDGGPKCLPIGGAQLPKLGNDLKAVQSSSVCASMDGLNLQKRIFFIELDGDVGPSQADVCKKGSEPPVGLNDAFVMFIPLTACQIHW